MAWKIVKLGDVLFESKVESFDSNPDKRITVRLNCKGVEKRLFEAGVEGGTKYFVRSKGQFIYGKQNLFKGAFGLVPNELDKYESSQDIPAFDIADECLPDWLIYFLRQGDFYKTLENLATGTGSRRIQPAKLYDVKIPLPDIAEQKEIICRLQRIEKEHSLLNKELDQQQTYLQLLRQSILQEAVQGKLTHQNPADEPAIESLKRIKAEKGRLVKEGKLKAEKEMLRITDDEIPFILPKGWVWCRLADIAYVGNGSTPDKKEFTEAASDIPYLKVYNIVNQKIDFEYKPQYIKRECHKGQLKRSICYSGDVLMNIVGPPLGKIAIVPEKIRECNINQAIVVIRPYVKSLNNWIYWYLCEQSAVKSIVTKGTAGQDNISVTQSRTLVFPLPPLPEQHRIVAKVHLLQKQLKGLEAQVQQSRHYVTHLLQSVLQEAFEPKVPVPPRPSLQPAIPAQPLPQTAPYLPAAAVGIVAEPAVVYRERKIALTPDEELQLYFIVLNIASHKQNPQLEATLGDVKMEKTCHLGESLLPQLHFNRKPKKEQFGPADFKRLYYLHNYAAKHGIFMYDRKASYKKYTAGENFSAYLEKAQQQFSSSSQPVNDLLQLFLTLNSHQMDVLATTFAAWNNLLIKGQTDSFTNITEEARWHERKKVFTDKEIKEAIDILNHNHLQPKGTGKLVA